MNITVRRVELATAYLIALAVTDLPSLLIDVFGVPLPRLAFGLPWFTGLAVAAALTLWPLYQEQRRRLVGLWDVAYLATLAVWALLEGVRGELTLDSTISGILAWVSPWIASVAARMHLSVFGDVGRLVRSFCIVVVVLALAHLGLLVIARVGLPLPFVRREELIDRNSISLLVVAAVFVFSTWQRVDCLGRAWWLVAMVMIGFVHADLNGARAAKLVLVLVLTLQMARVWFLGDKSIRWISFLICVGMVFAVIGVQPLLHYVKSPELFGGGDAAISTGYRAGANWTLLKLFLSNPWTGVGWDEMLYARSGSYIGHTLYLNIPAAFGIAGLAPCLLAALWHRFKSPTHTLTAEHWLTAVLIIATASFVNDPVMWYGLVVAFTFRLGSRIEPVASRANVNKVAHFRPYYAAGAAVAVGSFAILAVWALQRDAYIATAELEIAQTGAYRLEAVEASSDAEEFVDLAILRPVPLLRSKCSLSGLTHRQALVIVCKGESSQEAVSRVNQLVTPTVRRHQQMFEQQRNAAQLVVAVDRASLGQLQDWAGSLDSQRMPIVGSRIDPALLSFVNLQRAVLSKNLNAHERVARLEHPDRIASGIRIVRREPSLVLCAAVALLAAAAVLLVLGVGAMARNNRTALSV